MVIDRDIIRASVDLFECMGMGGIEAYEADFEVPLLQTTK